MGRRRVVDLVCAKAPACLALDQGPADRLHLGLPRHRHNFLFVDTHRAAEVYREWLALARPADQVSPDGNRRPYWLLRTFRPVQEAYRLAGFGGDHDEATE